MRSVGRVALLLIANTLLLTACADRAAPVSPLMLTLSDGDRTLHVSGTHHRVDRAAFDSFVSDAPAYFLRAYNASRAVFTETGGADLSELEPDYSFSTGEDFERPSIEGVIETWDIPRAEAFREALNRFPGMNHVSRQEWFYDRRPWAALRYLSENVGRNLSGLSGQGLMIDEFINLIAIDDHKLLFNLEGPNDAVQSRVT